MYVLFILQAHAGFCPVMLKAVDEALQGYKKCVWSVLVLYPMDSAIFEVNSELLSHF